MSRRLLSTVYLFSFIIFVKSTIKPNKNFKVVSGEGFVAYLDVSESFGPIENCWFAGPNDPPNRNYGIGRHYKDGQMQRLDLNSSIPVEANSGELVLPFSSHQCGLRVKNLNDGSAGRWYLKAASLYGELEEDYFDLTMWSYQKNSFETIVNLETGRHLISCSDVDQNTKHCKIISDQGESWNQCQVTTIITQNRTFDCLTFKWGQIEPSREQIVIRIKNSSQMQSTAMIEETENNYILRCFFTTEVSSCQAEMPDQKNELFIEEGLYNGKYSSYDTQIGGDFCALEIPKPLAPNEIGLWRIKKYETDSVRGCIFHIGGNKTDIIEKELDKIKEKELVELYYRSDNFPEITCTFPFAIDDCYLRAPDSTIYFPTSVEFEHTRPFGNCTITGFPALGGTWQCGARGQDYPKEIIRDIEVFVKSNTEEVLPIQREGKYVKLRCDSGSEAPIEYCVFEDPQNHVHLMATANSMKTEGHVQYSGRGLNMGECGVKIGELTAEDYGTWRCQFRVLTNEEPSHFHITLTDQSLNEDAPVDAESEESSQSPNTPSP